jgi:hypothetical protein
MRLPRALYVSPMGLNVNNGMLQRQRQTLSAMCGLYEGAVDVLSLAASPTSMRRWLGEIGLAATVLDGVYARLARLNTAAWYGGGVILCNRLRWVDRFRFPLHTPLPKSWIDRYSTILCYYPWAHCLLRLGRGGRKVVVDLGDVMAERHERIGIRRWISLDTRDERAILESGSRCVAISEDDALEFRRLYGVTMPVLPFSPADSERLMALADAERPARVGFIGAPNFQNEEILRLLATPAFLDGLAKGGVELIVAGSICESVEATTLAALRRGGARVLGCVGSLESFYRQVAAVLNPVGPSTGVKIKSVETLMTGRSLITTRWGADSSLRDAFGSQVNYVNWPIDAQELCTLTIDVVRAATTSRAGAAHAYAESSKRALHTLLTP